MSSAAVRWPELLAQVVDAEDPHAAAALVNHTEGETQEQLLDIALPRRRWCLHFAAAPYAGQRLLRYLGGLTDRGVWLRLARNPATPSAVFRDWVRAGRMDAKIAARIAAHPATPPECLEELGGRYAVWGGVVKHPGAGAPTLWVAAGTAERDAQRGVAAHRNADGPGLHTAWACGDRFVQADILAHRNCAAGFLTRAVHAVDVLWRRRAAASAALPEWLRSVLRADEDPRVRAAAVRAATDLGPEGQRAAARDPAPRVAAALARRPDLETEVAETLLHTGDSSITRWLARNPSVPESILATLAEQEDAMVRRSVARNTATPQSVLAALAGDPEPWVRAGVALRDDLTPVVYQGLEADADPDVLQAVAGNPRTRTACLEGLREYPDRDIRRALAGNPSSTAWVLEALVTDPYPFNRVVLTGHPNLTLEQLWTLADDPHPQPRFCAYRRLGTLAEP